jgi:hypothetical protein
LASDDSKTTESSEKGKEEKHGVFTKAWAALFASVVAPVLLATGLKFSDALVALVTSKPEAAKEAAKEEPAKTETAKQEAGKSDAPPSGTAKTDAAKPQPPKSEPAGLSSATTGEPEGAAARGAGNQSGSRGRRKKVGGAGGDQAKLQGGLAFQQLFNGRDLSGWTTNELKRWSVDSSVPALVGQLSSGENKVNHSWIFTEHDYSDFQLRVEFRLGPTADSGIAFRTHPGASKGSDDRLEIQLAGDQANSTPTGTVVGERADKNRTRPKTDPKQKQSPEWNSAEVKLVGSHLTVTINGQLVQDAQIEDLSGGKKGGSSSGRIGFQCRAGHVEFRKIEVHVMNSPAGK